jgi:hypothetical protein
MSAGLVLALSTLVWIFVASPAIVAGAPVADG